MTYEPDDIAHVRQDDIRACEIGKPRQGDLQANAIARHGVVGDAGQGSEVVR